ncbi:MAG TPA: CPBP family intramembrane glutamic endopeptidase [Pyrinomonadaceae bacterium]
METSKEASFAPPLPPDSYAVVDPGLIAAPPSSTYEVNPDNPPWGVLTAVLAWLGSVVLLVGVQFLVIIPYAIYRYGSASLQHTGQALQKDPAAILLSVLSTIPAHVLTLGLVWAIVTGFGKRPFWRTLGWSWSRTIGPGTSILVAVLVLIFGFLMTTLIGGDATEVDQIVASSLAARISIALLATVTAPLVEEMIYRGLIYSALQRVTGMLWAVITVSFLFTFVHVFQYSNNLGVIAAITIFSLSLTLMRAYTGRLLPCYVMHLVFNGLQSVVIVLEPYIRRSSGGNGEQKAAIIHTLTQLIRNLS